MQRTLTPYGGSTREPVYSGSRRVRGLYQRRRADGSLAFEARIWLDGRDRWVTLDAETKTDAIRENAAVRVDRDRGETRHRSLAPTLDEVAEEWLDVLESRVGIRDENRRRAQRTADLYRQRLRDHVLDRLGSRRVDEVGVDDLRRLVDRLGAKPKRPVRPGEDPRKVPRLAPGTVTSVLNIVSGLLRFALKEGYVAHNVVRDLDRDDRPGSKRQSEPRYLSAADLDRLLGEMSDVFRPVAYACTYAGLRISEALGLRWRDVDLRAGTITVSGQLAPGGWVPTTKTPSSAATVPMLPALRRELVAHRSRQASRSLALVRDDALVFTTARGKPQSRRNALRALHRAGDSVGLNGDGLEPVGLHDLRHSLVAIALADGRDPAEAAGLARHANPKVTLAMYGGSTEEGRERAFAKLAEGGFGA